MINDLNAQTSTDRIISIKSTNRNKSQTEMKQQRGLSSSMNNRRRLKPMPQSKVLIESQKHLGFSLPKIDEMSLYQRGV